MSAYPQVITFTKEGIYWVISSPEEPDHTEKYTNKNVALDMFEKVIQVAGYEYFERNAMMKEARKLGRGKLRSSKKIK